MSFRIVATPLFAMALAGISGCQTAPESEPESSAADEVGAVSSSLGSTGTDPFGVRGLYPTAWGGREWYLPSNADVPNAEWQPGTAVSALGGGVFHVTNAPRMMVVSPTGKAWWRNVEMTTYVRERGTNTFYPDQVPHWTMFARGEQHNNDFISATKINAGVLAPAGTATWPGYPFAGATSLDHACLASCYHGLFYPTGKVLFEKEITHTEGYSGAYGQTTVPNLVSPLNRWVGLKYVVRNEAGNTKVKTEMWIDANATGNWVKASEAEDASNWYAGTTTLNGCGATPFNYKQNQVVTWAGPWASFRSDDLDYDFKWLSVREVAPLP